MRNSTYLTRSKWNTGGPPLTRKSLTWFALPRFLAYFPSPKMCVRQRPSVEVKFCHLSPKNGGEDWWRKNIFLNFSLPKANFGPTDLLRRMEDFFTKLQKLPWLWFADGGILKILWGMQVWKIKVQAKNFTHIPFRRDKVWLNLSSIVC